MPRRTPLRVVLNGLGAMTGTRAPLEEVLAALGCGGHPDRSADTLSTGTALKALIGQALTSAADLVVLDEPAAHFDEDATSVLVRLIEQARRRGAAGLAAGAGAPLPGSAVARLADGHLTPEAARR